MESGIARDLRRFCLEKAKKVPGTFNALTFNALLKAHWDVIAAIDFTTVEVWTKSGLTTYYLLFVIELNTRRVHFAGSTVHPNDAWMKQTARELTDHFDGFLAGKKFLIMDRDTKFSESFRTFIKNEGIKPVRLPPRSPNMNAYMERFFRSLKSECLNQLILFGERSLIRAVKQYLIHYHTERNHQGLANQLIQLPDKLPDTNASIVEQERLGGLLRSYHRAA